MGGVIGARGGQHPGSGGLYQDVGEEAFCGRVPIDGGPRLNFVVSCFGGGRVGIPEVHPSFVACC